MAPSELQICRTRLNQRRTGKNSDGNSMETPMDLRNRNDQFGVSPMYPLCIDGDLKNSWKPHGIVPIMNMGLSENSGENRRTTWFSSAFSSIFHPFFLWKRANFLGQFPSPRRHMLRSLSTAGNARWTERCATQIWSRSTILVDDCFGSNTTHYYPTKIPRKNWGFSHSII